MNQNNDINQNNLNNNLNQNNNLNGVTNNTNNITYQTPTENSNISNLNQTPNNNINQQTEQPINNQSQVNNMNQPSNNLGENPSITNKPLYQENAQGIYNDAENSVRLSAVDPTKIPKKTQFSYEVINSQGQKVRGTLDAYSQDEVENYLLNEGNTIVKLKALKDNIFNKQIGGSKLSYADLAFILTQLSTYLKAGIPLIDSVRILEKQSVKASQKRIFGNIVLELTKGESLSEALISQGKVFPMLLINMIKTAEMTGDLPSILDDMTDYYTTMDRTRKQAVSAMTYPIIIFVFSLMVITFILLYIIPQFVSLFEQNRAKIPALTRFVINVSNFLKNNFVMIIVIVLIVIITYSLLFKYVKPFRKAMQTFYMKLPVIGKMTIYKEVAMFTKTFASLLNHNVFITDSMAILSTITDNEVYSEIINDSLNYLAKGAKISESFKGKWAFPVVAYEMLVTGENTGRLPMMMTYVANYYNDLHANYVKRINTFIEPVMIILLAIIVGTVVLSVVIPMFSFASQIL